MNGYQKHVHQDSPTLALIFTLVTEILSMKNKTV